MRLNDENLACRHRPQRLLLSACSLGACSLGACDNGACPLGACSDGACSLGTCDVGPATSENSSSAQASSALDPLASTFNSEAASLPALASTVAASKAPCVLFQVAASSFSAQSPQTHPDATHPTPLLHLFEAPSGEAPASSAPSTGSKVNAVRLPDQPHSDSVNDSDKKRRVNKIKLKRTNNRKCV